MKFNPGSHRPSNVTKILVYHSTNAKILMQNEMREMQNEMRLNKDIVLHCRK